MGHTIKRIEAAGIALPTAARTAEHGLGRHRPETEVGSRGLISTSGVS
jgi:hypothetical protein